MKLRMSRYDHQWNLPVGEAVLLQKKLAGKVVRKDRLGRVESVAGIDASFKGNWVRAAVVVVDVSDLKVIEAATSERKAIFPYIPGLLSFLEGPVVLDALNKLSALPDLLIFDGQGIAHPRRLGIASHIGLLLDIPAIGCAKSRLCGQHRKPEPDRGSHTPLVDKGETIGAVLRTRSRVKPVFVSIGHRVALKTSIEYVLSCCKGFRLPETTRLAHRLSRTHI